MSLRLLLPIILCLMLQGGVAAGASPSFAQRQNNATRMKVARVNKGEVVRARFDAAGVAYPASSLLLRIFKREALLELWAANSEDTTMTRVATYPVCANSGELGPKRRRGDLQVPEGFYVVSAYNPNSSYHLALGVSYPNRSDRILGRKLHDRDLGGNIAIHGDCVTIGCVPIENAPMEELYIAVTDTRIKHGRAAAIHVFPAHLDDEGLAELLRDYPGDRELEIFWRNLKTGYDAFEATKRLPKITVGADGRYRVKPR